MPGIFPFIQDFFDGSREIWLLSDTHGYTPTGLESSTTSQLQLHLPEVWPPAQYLIDAGLRPALARRLSSTFMDFVARYRETCQSYFDRATHGRGHLTEYYHDIFISLFKRAIQASGSQIVSIVRAQLRQADAPQVIVRPERVDIRVDDAAKVEIIARLGLKATSDNIVTSPSADVTSRLEEVLEQTHALFTDTVNSRLMLPKSPPILSTSRRYDPFGHVAPQTCFPAPYPPPPASCLPRSPLLTSFIIPSTSPRDVRSLARHSPDMSTLTNLFGRMTTMTQETDSRIPRSHGVFCIPDSNRTKPMSPILSPSVVDNSTMPRLTSVKLIASPTKPTNTLRRRKIASLPTRRGKTSAPSSPPVFDSAGAISRPITPCPTERVAEVTTPDYVITSPQKTRLVSTLPPLYTAVASCAATPNPSIPRQRKVHTLHPKTPPRLHTIPKNQVLVPLAMAGETFSYTVSRSPPLVSDATSYFDSPPTSSDELDTPPSTPPRSHVLLAHASTEGLVISSKSDGIVSRKGPLGDTKLPNPRQRYMHLDFTKGGWGRDKQPLTFTFGV
ncbi:hypothetical protein EDB85DRAFT_1909957 [Lactarius pseudohatsudake]|nr:hypothetical protein EDB85DRAFT_1909957 [Lactarius pseudohatsudake]